MVGSSDATVVVVVKSKPNACEGTSKTSPNCPWVEADVNAGALFVVSVLWTPDDIEAIKSKTHSVYCRGSVSVMAIVTFNLTKCEISKYFMF